MAATWESHLQQWTAAGLVDEALSGRIRAWELEHGSPRRWRWPVWIALAFGAVLLGAGVLLFVSAHWEQLSPSQRLALVLLLMAGFHAAGAALARRFEGLSMALHTVGTISLGGAIAVAGQIFHLAENWPAEFLLWAAGAALGWVLLKHWTQGALTALLAPYWLVGEVLVREASLHPEVPVAAGLCALSFTYLSARRSAADSALRKALGWIGSFMLLPATFATVLAAGQESGATLAWTLAIAGPLGVAWLLRGRAAIWNAGTLIWTLSLLGVSGGHTDHVLVYLWCLAGAVGLVIWGMVESSSERINLGSAGFALTGLAFYFSTVMDKLGRSAGLMALGVLFLGGGWLLERARRRLIASIQPEEL
jgi:uncharacterized membrane protein